MKASHAACICFLVAGLGLATTIIHAGEPKIERPIDQAITLLDASGGVHSLEPVANRAVRVYVFLTGECPISRSYIPLLNRLWDQWSREGEGVRLYGVWADATTSPADMARFAADHEIRYPLLVDREGELAGRFKPTHVPEAFVVDAEGVLAYRGRIDDRYLDLGRPRPNATEDTLADAVAAVLQGAPVANARTQPVGCFYESPPAAAASESNFTFTRDVAPILYANCVICHRPGEVAPFSLTSYLDAAKRAKQIAHVVHRRLMPPWKAAETHGEFKGQRTLTARQIDILTAWAEGDRAEGDPADLPAMPQFASGWQLGEPDLVLEMPVEFEVPADGPDLFQNFVIPVDIPEDKMVAAADFIPGNPGVVHHSILFLDANHVARQLDLETPEPGYGSFGNPGFIPTGAVGGWSPGKMPRRLPDGTGRQMRKGSDLVMQIHYHPNGKRETDRSKVGLYFVDEPTKSVVAIWASAFSHDIPPGDDHYRVTASYTLPKDVVMYGTVPHMHLLGRELTAVAVLPDGTRQPLIHIPDWDFYWQGEYFFSRPIRLPKGTRLDVEAFYDNSSGNPSNPSSPPRRVIWGEQSTDEMLYCFFYVSVDDPHEIRGLLRDVVLHEIWGKALMALRR